MITQLGIFMLMLDEAKIPYEQEVEEETIDIHFEFNSADCYFTFSKNGERLLEVEGSANFYCE